MHELALMQGILEQVEQKVVEHALKKVTRVKLVVGKMTAALPDALRFCFSVLTEDGPCAGAELEIEEREIVAACSDCKEEFTVRGIDFRCPRCNGRNTRVVQGNELYIDFIEGE